MTRITEAYQGMNSGDKLVETFSSMILGAANSQTLTPEEKEYIIDLLADQLAIEVQCRDHFA